MNDLIKTGTIKGTGATLNVEVGFVPSYVKVLNIDDAGALAPTIEWCKGMAAASGFKTLKTVDSGSTGNASSAKVTSNGISEYAGEAPFTKLTGTVAATSGSATLTGTNTSFLAELKVGDTIKLYDGQELVVSAIASATSLTVSTAATASVATNVAIRKDGRKAGFTIGADADINVSGETIVYMAIA